MKKKHMFIQAPCRVKQRERDRMLIEEPGGEGGHHPEALVVACLVVVLFGNPWVAVAQEVCSHEICISRGDNHSRCA